MSIDKENKKIQIDMLDFAFYVDRLNSGHDRDCVFHYLQDYLKTKGKIIDLEKELKDQDED